MTTISAEYAHSLASPLHLADRERVVRMLIEVADKYIEYAVHKGLLSITVPIPAWVCETHWDGLMMHLQERGYTLRRSDDGEKIYVEWATHKRVGATTTLRFA